MLSVQRYQIMKLGTIVQYVVKTGNLFLPYKEYYTELEFANPAVIFT